MFVDTRDPRPVGSEVAFDLKLADGFRLFHGHGEVAWVRLHDGGREQPQGMALRFIALDEKGRELVLKVLEEQVKAGGQPFEVDPPPADALLDYGGGPLSQAPPAADDFAEEPTMIGRRRSLDETGFDAPWGQKLPEVPTDLLDDGPSVPSVSEVQFAPVGPARPIAARPPAEGPAAGHQPGGPPGALAGALAAAQSSLFAAAFPGRNPSAESPVDLGFVLDENPPAEAAAPASAPPAATGFAPAGGAGWALGSRPFVADTLAPDEDPLVDFDGAPADPSFEPFDALPAYDELPAYEAPPAYDALPAYDSEEPTMIGSSLPGGAGDWSAAGSRMPAAGVFEVGPAGDFAATEAPRTPAAEPWSPDAAPAWDAPSPAAYEPLPAYDPPAYDAPAAYDAPPAYEPQPAYQPPPAGGRAAKPSLFDDWSPAAPAAVAPADPFAAPVDPFGAPASSYAAPAGSYGAPADPFAASAPYAAPADPFAATARERYGAPGQPPPEPYQPFDLGGGAGRPSGLEDAAEGFGLGAPPPSSPSSGYPAPAPPIFPAGYFAGGGPVEPGAQDPYYAEEANAAEGWPIEEEPPSRGDRFKAALMSRKAIWGLVATAILVTGAYFLAGNLLDGGEAAPIASGPPPAARPPLRREEPAAPGPAATADPNAPEQVIARDGELGGPPASSPGDSAGSAGPALADGVGEDAPVALPPAARPAAEPLGEASRPAPAPAAAPPAAAPAAAADRGARGGAPASLLAQIEVQKGAGQTVVELVFDGEMPSSSYRHDRLEYKRDREMITFGGVGSYRGANRTVGSPELSAINLGIHPDGLHVVFVRPPGARISNITSEGNRVRVVLDR